jgi:rare lipoprotein A
MPRRQVIRTHLERVLVAGAAALLLSLPAVALAAPSAPPAAPIASSVVATGSTSQSLVKLQKSIYALQAEETALDTRIAVSNTLVQEQTQALNEATSTLATAQDLYNERVVAMYKSGDYDLLSVLFDSDSFTDLVGRLELITRVIDSDRTAIEELAVVASQAQFQTGQLDALNSQVTSLQSLRTQRASTLATSVADEQTLETSLGSTSLVDEMVSEEAVYKADWVAASVPTGTAVPHISVRVISQTARYVSSKYHYAKYRATSTKFTATASWYGSDYNGKETASGELFNAADLTCASRKLPIGTWLAITRYDPTTKSTRRVIVVVNDRGPYVKGQSLQLSRAAADVLGFVDLGVATVKAEVVKPVS